MLLLASIPILCVVTAVGRLFVITTHTIHNKKEITIQFVKIAEISILYCLKPFERLQSRLPRGGKCFRLVSWSRTSTSWNVSGINLPPNSYFIHILVQCTYAYSVKPSERVMLTQKTTVQVWSWRKIEHLQDDQVYTTYICVPNEDQGWKLGLSRMT